MSILIRKLSLFILGILWLTACVSTSTLVPVETQRPVENTPVPLPSKTLSPTMTSTFDAFDATKVAYLTQLAVDELTKLANQTEIALAPTNTPRPTLTLQPTVAVTPTTTPVLPIDLSIYQANASPSGSWIAYTNALSFPDMLVANQTGTIQWKINYFNPDYPNGDGFYEAYVSPVYWTSDDRYLFFDIRAALDGCPGVYSSNMLARLDLTTGNVSEILSQGGEYLKFYSYAFAPNGAYLAYMDQSIAPLELKLLRFGDGNVEVIQLNDEYESAGHILWSPDQNRLIISAWISDPDAEFCGWNKFIVLVDRESEETRVIVNSDLTPIEWLTENEIVVGNRESKFTLNLTTGELIPTE